jgi:hypothetical protein
MTLAQAEGRKVRAANHLGASELEKLRSKINDKAYLYEAIECLAVVLSNELLNIPQGGVYNEWEGWK